MSTDIQAIFNAALSLPPDNRVDLAERLLASLTSEEQQEIDKAWASEAADRLRAFDRGEIAGIPYDEVKRSLRGEAKS